MSNRYMTFSKTSELIAEENGIIPETVHKLLSELIQDGYIEQSLVYVNKKKIRVIKADWDKIESDGLIE